MREALHGEARRYEVQAGESQIDALIEHFKLVQKWNRAAGLTAVRTENEAVALYAEAFQILDQFEPGRAGVLMDLGSGGGYPGLVLAVLRPSWQIRLVERSARKAAFLQEASRELGLPNVRVLQLNLRRAETLPVDQPFERLTAKAVGQFQLTLDLLTRRGAPSARAIVLTGEDGRRNIVASLESPPMAKSLNLQEVRRLAGRRSSFALIVSRTSTP